MNASTTAFRQIGSAPTIPMVFDSAEQIDPVLRRACRVLLNRQREEGFWQSWPVGGGRFEAEAILMLAFLKREGDPRLPRLTRTLLELQGSDGGWSQYPGGPSDADSSTMVYLALRLTADDDSAALRRARERLVAFGRGSSISPRTRLFLALFGQVPHSEDWSDLLTGSPVEEWALQVLNSFKPIHPLPRDPAIAHLLSDEQIRWPALHWNPMRSWSGRKAAQELRDYFSEECDVELAGPTSVLPLMALGCMRLPVSSADVIEAWRQFDARCRSAGELLQVTPFLAPQRDTSRAILALLEAGMSENAPAIQRAGAWLWDWLTRGLARGDSFHADVALALLALARCGVAAQGDKSGLVEHAIESLLDQQADDGSWGTPESTGLAIEALVEFGLGLHDECIADAIAFLTASQDVDTSWCTETGPQSHERRFRVLNGLRAVGLDHRTEIVGRAIAWLKRSWHANRRRSATQTSWTILALLAAGEANSPEIDAGIDEVLDRHLDAHGWSDESFACPENGECHFDPMNSLLGLITALAQFRRQRSGFSACF